MVGLKKGLSICAAIQMNSLFLLAIKISRGEKGFSIINRKRSDQIQKTFVINRKRPKKDSHKVR